VDNFDSTFELLLSWREEAEALRDAAFELDVRANELETVLFPDESEAGSEWTMFDDYAPATPVNETPNQTNEKAIIWGTGAPVKRITVTTASGDTVVWGN
jgi:hypothetical protein